MLVAEAYLANVWEQALCDLPNPVGAVWLLDAPPQLVIHCCHHIPRHKPAGQSCDQLQLMQSSLALDNDVSLYIGRLYCQAV